MKKELITKNKKHISTKLCVFFISIILFSVFFISSGTYANKGKKYENRFATLNVKYSSSRYNLNPEYKDGIIKFLLYEHRAPITTSNFINLTEEGFYNGVLFHRVIDDFVIQSGDPNTKDKPTGTPADWWDDGDGGSDETIPLESHEELTHIDGAVGMAREFGDPDSASSQFYICDGAQHRLDDTEENNNNRTYRAIDDRGYAVFGVVVEGIEIVREIAIVWTTTDIEQDTPDPVPDIQAHVHDHPIYDAEIKTIEISPLIEIKENGDDDFPLILLLIPPCIGVGSVIYYKKDFFLGIKKL